MPKVLPATDNRSQEGTGPASVRLLIAKLVGLAAIVFVTNPGTIDRLRLQLEVHKPGTFVIYLIIWGLSLLSLAAIAVQPRWPIRLFWAVVVGVASAVAWGYQHVSQIELTVFDGLSLWEARHEAGNAVSQYSTAVMLAVLFCAATIGVLMLPAGIRVRKWTANVMAFLPALPIGLLAGVLYLKVGNGSAGMPKQFSQISIAALVAYKTVAQPMPEHQQVNWVPRPDHHVQKIVLIMDEGIRADFLDGSGTEMPGYAAAMRDFINFGPAASTGVCSNYSNTLLRFAAARGDLGPSLSANPTLWQYAKKAGYRTVYIDAQARNITNLSNLQNFMTPSEARQIDAFYALRDAPADKADYELADIIRREMAAPGAVFIYANKQGTHPPYDDNYPATENIYHPTITELGHETYESRVGSYRNGLRWNVDRFFGTFWPGLAKADSVIVYTSDHAQYLNPEGLTHCIAANPNQRMANVPLAVYASDAGIKTDLRQGAAQSAGRASDFMIAPSLLGWMGYLPSDVGTKYSESLTTGTHYPSAFTSGDIFGLFANAPVWNAINLRADLKSNELSAPVVDAAELPPSQQPWLNHTELPVGPAVLSASHEEQQTLTQ